MKLGVYILCVGFIILGILAYNGVIFSQHSGYRHLLPISKNDGLVTSIVFIFLLIWTIYDDYKRDKNV